MTGELVDVGGCRAYVDVRGHADLPPLVFVHGGPGLGSLEFMATQGPRLEDDLLLLGMDQRGVLRSDPLPAAAGLDVDTIVDDLETVRKYFGLERWSLLAHSAGAMYAAEYVAREPHVITSVVYDCPVLDGDAAERARLGIVARLARARGDATGAEACERLAGTDRRLTPADGAIALARSVGGGFWDEVMFADAAGAAVLERLRLESGLADEQWEQGASHAGLYDEVFIDRVPLVTGSGLPTLVVRGAGDIACPPQVVDRLTAAGVQVHTFDASAHFAFLEEPDAYADVVRRFVAGAGDRS